MLKSSGKGILRQVICHSGDMCCILMGYPLFKGVHLKEKNLLWWRLPEMLNLFGRGKIFSIVVSSCIGQNPEVLLRAKRHFLRLVFTYQKSSVRTNTNLVTGKQTKSGNRCFVLILSELKWVFNKALEKICFGKFLMEPNQEYGIV